MRSVRVRRKRSAHDATALLGLPADLCGPVERGELTLDEALKLAKPAGASVAEHEELRRRGGAEASPGYEDFLSSTPRLSRLERLDAEIERLSKEVDLLEDLAATEITEFLSDEESSVPIKFGLRMVSEALDFGRQNRVNSRYSTMEGWPSG